LLRALVGDAGFSDPEIEEITFAFHYRDFDEFWEVLVQLSACFAAALAAQSEYQREALRLVLAERLAQFSGADGGCTMPASSWGIRMRR
jgi:hypothetical protein